MPLCHQLLLLQVKAQQDMCWCGQDCCALGAQTPTLIPTEISAPKANGCPADPFFPKAHIGLVCPTSFTATISRISDVDSLAACSVFHLLWAPQAVGV